ncbi:MAG: thiamine diphosphokinase [Lachnospiraceae bacterium]|nr:thiamine diphosphokinase [Lachnospiraceae bacterium]
MNTLIISGGNIEVDFALEILKKPYDRIIGVDAGLLFCREHHVIPTSAVGDFDTLPADILMWYKSHTNLEIREYNPVKDAADTQIAVEMAIESGSTDITILGGTGTRLDHVLGNIQVLYLPLEKGINCEILDSHNRIRLIRNRHVIQKEAQYGTYFSLIPFTTDVYGVTLTGAKYPLHQHHFTVLGTGSLGVSNEILEEQVEILLESGILILIESKD